ncbi:putative amine oxidase [copper-containing] isoform X3 [Dreissena polymorpha]|uniref:putative amine oxidase [copper-containing] isoform X3 n=1 Tax=Dreissena polymorpha TaxID=45954 RepID=UPI002264FD1A|nr:putative amine oxidase [copper-containing] isoform X3 [Dreissena polymorpha]
MTASLVERTAGEPGTYRRTIGVLRIAVVVLAAVIVILVIAFAVVVTQLKEELSSQPGDCPSTDNIKLDPPDILPPFHDLTRVEIASIREFMYSEKDLSLVRATDIQTNNSYIYLIELKVPKKDQVLQYLDNGQAQPVREALVLLFRGDKPEPYIQEYTVGPLPNPYYKKDQRDFPFRYRPPTIPELIGVYEKLNRELHESIGNILKESYGGSLVDCEDQCLKFQQLSVMPTTASNQPRTRKVWFSLAPYIEFYSLHPLDFAVLVDMTSTQPKDYHIDALYYAGDRFKSIEELQRAYEFGSVTKTKIPFPTNNKDLYSTLNRRGSLFPSDSKLPPREYEPDGQRYSINGRHIEYMGWQFDLRMSTSFGPQLFDIKYNGKRIVYELSLQEIAVFYSANNPSMRFADYTDSSILIGGGSRGLVAGADCPHHSTFLSADHSFEFSDDAVRNDRAFCIFEHNTGQPIRRHLTSNGENKFYEGMMDIVLTVRTIPTILNYDYIFDFIFHQNGAIEVKSVSTGYILASFRNSAEDDYGFRLKNNIIGNIHHHMFNFKVDMDINGRPNRFETIEIVPKSVDNTLWSSKLDAKYEQTMMVREQQKTEKAAVVDFDFTRPQYYTFYNNQVKSPNGVPKAYRLLIHGMSKQLLFPDRGQEPSVAWARHQLAVTKYKDSERTSSSLFSIWDGEAPVVDFRKYIEDDEVITDQDQVAWVTMGMHHIPHMEDLPVTPTVGLDLRFFLLPYNYFDEDPAMGSGDAVRIEPRDQQNLHQGVHIENYGKTDDKCFPRKSSFYSEIRDNPGRLFN